MWTPTHVQVTVQKAKGLLSKGKNGTNDVFVTIGLGKEKYQTSVKERATDPVEWLEECELPIPKQGNKAEIVLTVLHRNFIGDEFLGLVSVPLQEFDFYEKPKNKWYELKSKPGQHKNKYRGEIEVRIGFTVQSGVTAAGSLSDFSKKDGLRSSFGQLSSVAASVGGSLLSLRSREKKGFKNFAKAVGNKVSTLPGRGKKKNKEEQFGTIPEQHIYSGQFANNQRKGEADPGVVSDDEDEFRFDELSHKSSHSSLSASQVALNTKEETFDNVDKNEISRKLFTTPSPAPNVTEQVDNTRNTSATSGAPLDEWQSKLFGTQTTAVSVSRNESKNSSPVPNPKTNVELKREPEVPKPEIIEKRQSTPTAVKTIPAEKEPVPKPRHLHDASHVVEPTPKVMEVHHESKPVEKTKTLEKEKKSARESFASIFNSKSRDHDENSSQKNGTPVGITNPIRMKDNNKQDSRLRKEVIRRYEGKTRDDLIEMIVNLQNTVDHQKQKMADMEDYIDTLLVRVMENKPTLLQSPYVTTRPIKLITQHMSYPTI